uniref:Ankyrin repeat and LEM domain-containing protein 2 n=1 Tax=Paramormyrops kingsleyae TaxID=1676925 RepID=A0A3B3QKG2_9TELE
METVLSRLRTLGPDELRMEIINAGLKCGPITATTRALFEKKLASSILESQRSDGEASELNSNTDASPSNMCDGGDFGYSLGLNPPEEPSMARLDIATSCVNTEDGFTPQRDRHESPSQFYGVCPPMLDVILDDETVHVYENKKDAMKAVKKMKGARFKIFSSREAAEKFARGSSESSSSPCGTAPDLSPRKPGHLGSVRFGFCLLWVEHLNGEKANNYKTPRTQDLTGKLRKAVENGDWAAFSELVWSNPRYLIGSGDNPTIVQEGCRYNIMHVAAKENQPGIAQLLLDTLENPEFMRHMYPDDKEDMLRNRIRYVVDLYLNTPDKAAFETPLHFACKFGCPEVVKVLCSHPDTDKNCKNKYSQKPFSVICERKNKTQEIKQKIKEYLEDQYYVPLLRATDNSSQPVIGAPQSPEHLDQVPHWLGPELQGNPKDPVMTVRAVAGPLSQTKAEEFRKTWKNPPRDRASYFHHILKSDPNRGAERVGRELAHELGYLWEEYWEFLGTFVNLAAADGLEVLEGYLNKKDYSEADSEETRKSRTGDCIKGIHVASSFSHCVLNFHDKTLIY